MARIILPLAIILVVVGSVVSQQPKVSPSGLNEPTLKAHIKFLWEATRDFSPSTWSSRQSHKTYF